jgi:hypothetical protein
MKMLQKIFMDFFATFLGIDLSDIVNNKKRRLIMDAEIFIPISLFIVIAYIIKVISDNRVRHRLIEKGQVDESIKNVFMENTVLKSLQSLKWGMVLIALGLALFIGQFMPYDIREEITVGGMFLFAGIALLIYYSVVRRQATEFTESPEV